MFKNLLESKAKQQKRLGGSFVSILFHSAIVVALFIVTQQSGITDEKPKEEKVDFVPVKPDEPKPPQPEPERAAPPADAVAAPPPPKGFQTLTAPVDIPDVLPDIDFSKKVTDENDFSAKGKQGGIAKGVEGGTGPIPQSDQPFYDFQVERQAASLPGVSPTYPDNLSRAEIEGTVLAMFVVDTSGRADMSTFKVIKSDHELFSTAVKTALKKMRFLPAEVGGRKVKQLVQQPFQFSLNR